MEKIGNELYSWGEFFSTLEDMKINGDNVSDELFSKAYILFKKIDEAVTIEEVWKMLDKVSLSELEINRLNSSCLDGLIACRPYKKFLTFLVKNITKYYDTLQVVYRFASNRDCYSAARILSTNETKEACELTENIFHSHDLDREKFITLNCRFGGHFLDQMIGPDIIKQSGEDFLETACQYGQFDAVKTLIQNGAESESALGIACMHGRYDIATFLIEKGFSVSRGTPSWNILCDAVVSGDLRIVKLIADNGVDIQFNNNRALKEATEYNFYDIAKFLLEKGSVVSFSLLEYAAKKSLLEIVKLFLQNGANVYFSQNFLHVFTNIQCKTMIQLLLDEGADINMGDTVILRRFVEDNNIDMIEFLLDRGANPNIGLIYAVSIPHLKMAQLFLDRGATNFKQALKRSSNGVTRMFIQKYKDEKRK